MTPEKVALIIPPSPFLADQRVFPFLGILKVAAFLRENKHAVDVLDLSGIGNYQEVVKDYLQVSETNLRIGITATTPQFPNAAKIVETIRTTLPKAKVILGGSHATMVGSARDKVRGEKAFNQMLQIFDSVVLGDGERAIIEAIKDDTAQIIDASGPKSALYLQRGTLEQYPFPARELIDLGSYHYEIDGLAAQSLIAQLGCPFGCRFCGGRDTYAFRTTRTRSTESIIAEIDELVMKYHKRGIMFYDDELNLNRESIMALLEGLTKYQKDNQITLRLRGFARADEKLFDQEIAKAMYKAGFRILLSGVESGDQEMLNTMGKKTTPEINSRLIKICHEAGLKIKVLMSIGHPGETQQSIETSLKWVLYNKPDDADWTVITEYPGSPYFDQSIHHQNLENVWIYTEPKTGNVLYSNDTNFADNAEYYKGIPGEYNSYVWTETLTPQKIVELREMCEKQTRQVLHLPAIHSIPALQFEHSMGTRIPLSILRSGA